MEIHAAALGVEAPGHRDGLQQRRFAGAILADQKRHRLLESQIAQAGDGGDGERIDIAGGEPIVRDSDAGEKQALVWYRHDPSPTPKPPMPP